MYWSLREALVLTDGELNVHQVACKQGTVGSGLTASNVGMLWIRPVVSLGYVLSWRGPPDDVTERNSCLLRICGNWRQSQVAIQKKMC